MVFEGIKGVYQRIYRFNFKCVRKEEKYANSKMEFKISFFLSVNLKAMMT